MRIGATWAALGCSGVICAVTVLTAPAFAEEGDPTDRLAAEFRNPPQSARPHVWWHWMSGNVTEEGAKLDLEWLQRVGVGGVHVFSGGSIEPTVVPKPAPFMSDVWRSTFRSSVRTARAVGMDVAIAGSPGWSQTGGPWVIPSDGMKKYVWSELQVAGGKPLRMKVPAPTYATGPFGAIPTRRPRYLPQFELPLASGTGPTIAFRTPDRERAINARYSGSSAVLNDLANLPDDLSREVELTIPKVGFAYVDADFGKLETISALTIASNPLPALDVSASQDGQSFHSVTHIEREEAERPAARQTFTFVPTTARYFRVRFGSPVPGRKLSGQPSYVSAAQPPKHFAIRMLRFAGGARVDRFEAKAGFQSISDFSRPREAATPAGSSINAADVIDLTNKLRADGTLDWTPPEGRWTIMRFGWSLTGQVNGPAEATATGLEVDKLDRSAVKRYIAALFSKYRDDAATPLGANGINSLLTDSWEAGVHNWTPDILGQFRRLRGYNPLPWMPVLAGRVVGNPTLSDAFLFDFRQTLKDLVIENHYEVLAAAARADGMTYYTEALGDGPRGIVDGMTAKSRADIPTAEFWYRPFNSDEGQPPLIADLAEAASAAHVYGKPLVAAEALTVAAGNDPWAFTPAMLKPVADEIFARGVNRMLIHDSHLQPFEDKKPGLTLAYFGQFFNRNDTWAEQAKPWVDYLARTSYMLQQGKYVADVAYFYGEEKPLTQIFEHQQNLDVPNGYGFDYLNPEGLLTKVSVENGRLITASGMTYRVLFVPRSVTRMTVPTLRKLHDLVRDGATVVARKPIGGLGMASSDREADAIADALWGTVGEAVRTIGRGKLYAAASLADALRAEQIPPDVQANGANILSLHRKRNETDIYFVTNRDAHAAIATVHFRTTGKAAEWWSAEDGGTRPLSYTQLAGSTAVMLSLPSHGAGFVVFRGRDVPSSRIVAAPRTVRTHVVSGSWKVRFQQGRGAPAAARFEQLADWTSRTEPGIRYFSGVGTYSKKIHIDKASLAASTSVLLDLGIVGDLAVVSINGREVATAWHAPYVVNLSGKLKPGRNLIEVAVVNTWVNRLIGDKQTGATAITYAPLSAYKADSPLRPSGLIGPVRFNFMK